jgi:hypothetical protein
MTAIILIIGSLILGIVLGIQIQGNFLLLNSKKSKIDKERSIENWQATDQEIWNIVTNYGKYKENWELYRLKGLLEAIKVRDEKAEFDRAVSLTDYPNRLQDSSPTISTTPESKNREPKKRSLPSKVSTNRDIHHRNDPHDNSRSVQKAENFNLFNHDQESLDEIDLASLKGIAAYFEVMPDKIRHYHRDHQASPEKAEVLANYYFKTANMMKSVKTYSDLKNFIKWVENLKEKVSRYKHESYKYRLSTGIEKEVLAKLKKLIA